MRKNFWVWLTALLSALVCICACRKSGNTQPRELILRADMPAEETWREDDLLYLGGRPGTMIGTENDGKSALFSFTTDREQDTYGIFYSPDGAPCDFGRIAFAPARTLDSPQAQWRQSPMYGSTSSGNQDITMNPLAAILSIELEDIDLVSSIRLTSRSGEYLSGVFRMNRDTGKLTPASGSSTSMVVFYNPALEGSGGVIHLDIPVPAQKYSKGFDLSVQQKGSRTSSFILMGNGIDAGAGSVIPVIPDVPEDPDDPVRPVEDKTLTVASYNVLVSEGRPEAMSMENCAQCMGETMLQTGADIIALNEIDETLATSSMYSLGRIGSSAGMEGYSWSIRHPSRVMDDRSLQYYYSNGFAYNTARVECIESEMMWFTTASTVTAAKETAKAGHVSKYCNMIWARFRHKVTGNHFYVIATHLPLPSDGTSGGYPVGEHACFCATALNNFVKNKDENAPWILLGDMNACGVYSSTDDTNYRAYNLLTSQWSDVYDELYARGTLDSFYRKYNGTLSGSSAKYYYDVYTFTSNQPTRRIDHIMVRNCSPLSYRTIMSGYMYNGKKYCPSDHIPVVATVSLDTL